MLRRTSLLLTLACTAPDAGIVARRPPPPCADPAARRVQPYDAVLGPTPVADRPPADPEHGNGVVVADFDGDDRAELIVLGPGPARYLDVAADGLQPRDGLPPLEGTFGGAAADYDADGDLDVYVTGYGRPNTLLANDGTGTFTDVTEGSGTAGPPDGRHAGAAWGDLDGDGDLDLVVAGHGDPPERRGAPFPPGHRSLLLRNDVGDGGGFTDLSDTLPARLHRAYTFVLTPLDLDGDGDLDLYAANDFGRRLEPGLLAWNEGGDWVLDDGGAGLDLPVAAMGTGIGDVDEDGRWDLLVSAWGSLVLATSTPDGRWVDAADARGLVPAANDDQVVGWGAELADLDNDTRLDAAVVFGHLDTPRVDNPVAQPDGVWRQADDGGFLPVAAPWGLDHRGAARALGVADLNLDGYLDLVVPDLAGPPRAHLSRCGDRRFLEVRLAMPGPNPDAVGAIVHALLDDGRELRRPILAGGSSLGSAGPPRAHFGLGAAEGVELSVTWPDGEVSTLGAVGAGAVTVERQR